MKKIFTLCLLAVSNLNYASSCHLKCKDVTIISTPQLFKLLSREDLKGYSQGFHEGFKYYASAPARLTMEDIPKSHVIIEKPHPSYEKTCCSYSCTILSNKVLNRSLWENFKKGYDNGVKDGSKRGKEKVQ